MQVLLLEDAFAHKLVECTERVRTANRDYYDIFFCFKKNTAFNEDVIFHRTGKDRKVFLKVLREHIAKKELKMRILEGLGELLDEKKKQWVKKNLKDELLGLLDFIIEQGERAEK